MATIVVMLEGASGPKICSKMHLFRPACGPFIAQLAPEPNTPIRYQAYQACQVHQAADM